jgi:hypothetical protein
MSGPQVPLQSSGSHFHVCSSGSLLDFVTPASNIRPSECNLSSLELDTLRWQRIVEGPEIFTQGYKWHYCTIDEDGTKVWLLGSPIEDPANPNQEQQLSEILAIDLKRYGILGNDSTSDTSLLPTSKSLSSTAHPPSLNLGSDLASIFDLSSPDSMTDFTITASPDDTSAPSSPISTAPHYSTSTTNPSTAFLSTTTPTSDPIHVHKMILHARWPHSVVRAFLYYLYTDSIAPSTYCTSLTDVAGMLVMANLYDMPKLRLLCVNRLSREIDIEHAAVIWERAGRTDEEWLKSRAARFCMMNWGRVVRTDGFRSLSRMSLMELCEVVDMEGRVVGGEELSEDGGFGGGRSGVGGTGGHRGSVSGGDEEGEEGEGEDMAID